MMRKLGIVAICIAAVIAGAIAWWEISYPTYTYRYRMTVEVEADGKVHSGSSVIQVTYEIPPEWLFSANRLVPQVKGEAVFVDLGGGRNVIALLAAGDNASNVDYPFYVVPHLFGLTFSDEDLPKFPRLQGSREMPVGRLPTLVAFSDLNDPKTARVVEPHEFPEVFGEGVRFRGATIEMTRDWVTRNIENRVLFLKPMREAQAGKLVLIWPDRLNVVPTLFIRN